MTRALTVWAVLLLGGCGSGVIYLGEDYDPDLAGPDGDPSVMQGVLGGEPWRLDQSLTTLGSVNTDVIGITFWTEGHEDVSCGDPISCDVPCVKLTVDLEDGEGTWDVGDYRWSFSYAVPVGTGGYGGPFLEGEVRILDADIQIYTGNPSTLSGWVSGYTDEDHHVQGTFRDVLICHHDDPYWP